MSKTLKKLGIEFKEISQNQIDDAVASIQSMRLEQILIADNETFDWQNLLQRPDLISIKYPEKLGTLFQEQETAANYSLFLFSSDSPFRKNIIRFVASKNYRQIQLLIAAISLIPFCIEASKISFLIEVVSNSLFGVDIIMKSIACGLVLHKNSYMRNIWNFINILAFILGWCIFLEDSLYKQILQAIRLLRVFRFIQEVSFLKIQFTAYVSSFLKLRSVLVPIFLVMIYFAVVGLHLFRGLTESRCRLTPEPENGVWEVDDTWEQLCGLRECPSGTFCGNPISWGLPKNATENDSEQFYWDFVRFDDFFHSLLVVFTILNVTGWSGTTFMVCFKFIQFWKAMTTYVTATYFLVLIVFLAFILSNLLLALFYESFMEKSSIKNSQKRAREEQEQIENEIKKKHQQQLMNRLTIMSRQPGMCVNQNPQFNLYFATDSLKLQNQKSEIFDRISNSKKFIAINNINIILSAVVIAIDYHEISTTLLDQLFVIDFCCIIYSLWEILLQLSGKGLKQYFSSTIHIFDFLIILSQFVLIFFLLVTGKPVIINHDKFVVLVKSLKILRVLRFIYFAQIIYTISVLTRSLISTLIKLKNIILLWGCLFFFIAVLGKSLLQYKMTEEEMTVSYDDFESALMASLNIFYNEEWHITMYKYARNTIISFIFYILSVILGQVFFIRLMTAIFLNEFQTQMKSIQQSSKPYDFNKIFQSLICKPKNKVIQKGDSKKKPKKTTENDNLELNSNNNNENRFLKRNIKSNSILNSIQHQPASMRDIDEFQNWIQQESVPQQSCQVSGKVIQNNQSSMSSPQSDLASSINKTFFLFSESNIIRVKVKQLIENLPFRIFLLIIVLASAIRIALFTPFLDPKSQIYSVLEITRFVSTIIFSLQIALNIIANGLYKGSSSYLQQSPYNILNFAVTLTDIIAQFFDNKQFLFNLLSSLRILEFIRIGAELNQNLNYISQALIKAFQTMLQLSIFCFIILLVYGTFSTKLLKGELYYCVNYGENKVKDKWECMDYGGSWINKILGYDNIFDSVLTLFVVVTTEAWIPLMVDAWSARGEDLAPENNFNRWWVVYFQFFFFIGNICMLNMFISLVVESYKETKIKAQGLSDLNENQREWFAIKKNINHLKPHVKRKPPSNKVSVALHYLIESKVTGYFWHSIIGLNSIILSLFYIRQNKIFEDILRQINFICIIIFTVEAVFRLALKFPRIKQKDIFLIIDFSGVLISLIDQFYVKNIQDDFYLVRSFGALSVAFQLLRNYYIIRRFPELERLFYSILNLIPSALAMLFIMFIFLFIYTSLGIDLFGYLRAQSTIDGFDLHFRKFTTAMFSLIRVASSEQWWALLVDSAHVRTPDFACIYIDNYEDFQQYGFNGCGTIWAYAFYISFHLIFSLVILNLFIASILGAYEEHVKQEQSAISKYQLHDVLNYWAQYDPEGTGFLNYKQFWKLSSEIAICFGVSQKDLLDPENKKNFLKAMNVPLYEDHSGLMGYLFHDVILSLTKISVELKYGVKDLEYGGERGEDNQHDYYKSFKYTPYNSGQMSAIIYLQGKVRALMNKRRGIPFLDLAALRQELQNQNENDKYGN